MPIRQKTLENQLSSMSPGSGNSSFVSRDDEEEDSRSALSAFRAKEEEIERKKAEVRDRVHAQLGRVEQESKRLALIREVLFFLISSLNLRGGLLIFRKLENWMNSNLFLGFSWSSCLGRNWKEIELS